MNFEQIIYQKENALLVSENRTSSNFISEHLTADFREFGSSGNIHELDDVISWLKSESDFEFEIINFKVEALSDDIALATYYILMNGSKSLRSSIWILENNIWKMKFHQGTTVRS